MLFILMHTFSDSDRLLDVFQNTEVSLIETYLSHAVSIFLPPIPS